MRSNGEVMRVLAIRNFLAASCLVAAGTAGHPVASEPARVFDDCSGAGWCPRMVRIPGGTFTIGSPATERGRYGDEGPQRTVTIPAFAAAAFPVTLHQWRLFVAATRRPFPPGPCAYAPTAHPSWREVGYAQSETDPVVCITWGDAQAYARWLTRRTGHRYRLLSESEWEYAARAGSTSAFPWGPTADHAHANYGQDDCCGPRVLGRDRWENTSPVGSFPPNRFGLYDMHGNVFEWVQDCHARSYARLPRDGTAFERRDCPARVARGGVFGDGWRLLRSAARNYAPPGAEQSIATYRSAGFGVRVARSLP